MFTCCAAERLSTIQPLFTGQKALLESTMYEGGENSVEIFNGDKVHPVVGSSEGENSPILR